VTQPFLTEFDPTTPEPAVIINGAPPAAAPRKRGWILPTVLGVGLAVSSFGWMGSAIAGNAAQEKATTATADLAKSRTDLSDAQRRLSANAATVDGLKLDLMDASNALSAASTGFDKAARVNEASCEFIDSVFPLIPALSKGDTVRLCESHTGTLKNWGSDAATASGDAANAGR